MSDVQLPQFIVPRKMARKSQILEGFLPLSVLNRVGELLVNNCGQFRVSFRFKLDNEGFSVIEGKVSGQVTMLCERCLGETCVDIEIDVSLACVYTEEQAKALPDHYDPLMTLDERTDLYALIEEELLLNLPIIAYHTDGSCVFSGSMVFEDKETSLQESYNAKTKKSSSERNPFAVLAQLKS